MSEREQLEGMNDSELVAYWNILQMGQSMIQCGDAADTNARHTPIVNELLTERRIPHKQGNLIETILFDRNSGKFIRAENGQPIRQKAA